MMKTVVKERPILFSGGMVAALRAGRKTQTRRAVNKANSVPGVGAWRWSRLELNDSNVPVGALRTFADNGYLHVACRPHPEDPQAPDDWTLERVYPRCEVGERLWVKETFLTRESGNHVVYRADYEARHGVVEAAGFGALYGGWKPSIHMPRKFSRITLELIEVRVQRLQEISEEDAEAEGCSALKTDGWYSPEVIQATASEEFARLWNRINGPGSWEANDWVWALSFRLL